MTALGWMKGLRRLAARMGRTNTYSVLTALVLLLLPIALPASGFLQSVDLGLSEWRAARAPRPVGDRFVFVAIDKQSLDKIGVWPWPRTVYAEVIDKLAHAGASDIFLDVDFSARSTQEADARLARSLSDAGGGVVLPAFVQYQNANPGHEATAVSRPLAQFEEVAWLASANVVPDPDGVVRSLPLGVKLDDTVVQSVAALLAGVPETRTGDFSVDFSISPDTVPIFSVADLLSGSIPDEQLSDKSVVIGAFATELKDIFAVPVYGLLNGPMLHILGAETLLQGRVLRPLDPMPYALALAGLIVLSIRSARSVSGWILLPLLFLTSGGAEAAAFHLQAQRALLLPTAVLQVILAAGLLLYLVENVDIGRWLARLAQLESRNSQKMLRRVIDDSADAVIILDHKGKVLEASRSAEVIFGTDLCRSMSEDFAENAPQPMAAALEKARSLRGSAGVLPVPFEFVVVSGGETRALEGHVTLSVLETVDGPDDQQERPFVACITVRDMTERRAYEEKLKNLSQFDELTGALRRDELLRRIEAAGFDGWAIFALNLHRFSAINTVLGRATGDLLLRAVAARLQDDVPEGALIGRTDGDGFCLAVPAVMLGASATDFADRVIALLSKPFFVGNSVAEIGARIGICCSAGTHESAGQLVAGAEAALDRARASAGSGYSVYDPDSAGRQLRALALEAEMKGALESRQFFVLYQPQVDLASGGVIGAEALVRWMHPEQGVIPPLEFIEIAEASGFICQLGAWVLEEACRAASAWPGHMTVAVNVSPLQFVRSDVVAAVQHALQLSGLAPDRLHLEITESAFLDSSDTVLGQLSALRVLGVKIALDDFGTGYSSLGYIAKFPLDRIKIDQAFVRHVASDQASRNIVCAIKALASGLGAKVVCEGIEGEAEWRQLASMGCEEGQGYYFGKPQSGEDILQLVAGPPAKWRAQA
ncbi:MAG: EAL domain-containing protein [Allorhizobium sp.]